MVYPRGRKAIGAGVPATIQAVSVPASVGGINAMDGLMAMPPQDCLYCYNLMPSEYGMRLRKCYREWATGANGDVRSLINYESNSSLVEDKLWAVTENGIYDVTLFDTTAPVEDVAFTVQGESSGYGVTTEFTNDASTHYLFYADNDNGIHQYDDINGWTVPTGWTYSDGAEPPLQVAFPVDQVCFVTVHKLRIWVILQDSDDAWYLPIASVAGELKKFTFGAKAPHGGRLMGLWDWTVDGGDGVDDYLVAMMKSGDLLVYRGGDPEATDWTTVGSWFIGQCTQSRKVAIQAGAELYLLSSYGITSIRDLLSNSAADITRQSPAAKIARYLRADVAAGLNKYEWQLVEHPGDGFFQIVTPEPTNTPYLQYTQNIATRAWGVWRDVPMLCGTSWNGEYFMGGKDGVVYINDGVLDGVTLDGSNVGEPPSFSVLTSFQSPGGHGQFKRVNMIRPIGIVGGQVNLNVDAVYDYNIEDVTPDPVPLPPNSASLWNSAYWNAATWNYAISGTSLPIGTFGMGRAFAVGMAGFADSRITVVGWDAMFNVGGLL